MFQVFFEPFDIRFLRGLCTHMQDAYGVLLEAEVNAITRRGVYSKLKQLLPQSLDVRKMTLRHEIHFLSDFL
jgi:hypothetical protein